MGVDLLVDTQLPVEQYGAVLMEEVDPVVMLLEQAWLVHTFTASDVVYCIRDVATIEREMALAEYDDRWAWRGIGRRMSVEASPRIRRLLEVANYAQSLPRFLYVMWERQKLELEFWMGGYEEVHFEQEEKHEAQQL